MFLKLGQFSSPGLTPFNHPAGSGGPLLNGRQQLGLIILNAVDAGADRVRAHALGWVRRRRASTSSRSAAISRAPPTLSCRDDSCAIYSRQLGTQLSLTIDQLLDFLPNAIVLHPIAFIRPATDRPHMLPQPRDL